MEEECWEYVDPKSVKRGPFAGKRMALWYDNHMLPEDLSVRHCPSMPFMPIREMFPGGAPPFRSRPRPAPPAPPQKCNAHWQYCDTKGQLQGPFTSAQMCLWYENSMLPKSLQLRRTTDSHFATITDYFPKPFLPFQSPPMTPMMAMPKEPPATSGLRGGPGGGYGLEPDHLAKGGQPVSLGSGTAVLNALAAAQAKSKVPAPKSAAPTPKVPAAHMLDAEAGKGGGKGGKGPVGGGAAGAARPDKGAGKKAKQDAQDGWSWSEQGWTSASDKAWWEGQWWNEWSQNGTWDHNGKQQGAEWKGDGNGPIGATPPRERGEKGNAVQAAFGSLHWGPYAEAPDLFPEETVRRVLDEGIVWEERWISPLAVRFSQGKIHPFFHERGPISEVMLQIKLRDPEGSGAGAVRRIDPPFPPVRLLYLKEQGVLVTLDNRRLYALQRFALQEWPTVCLARALCVDELTPTRLRAENRKFTNRLCGLQLEVESRSNAFDTFSWVTEAAHAEAKSFCRPAALRAADRAVSLLPVLVVHMLLCPRLRPLLRSRWPALQFAASVLPSPKRRVFQSRRLLLLHVLELAKPTRRVHACPPVCVGYKAETVVTLSKGKSCVTSKLSVERPVKLLKAAVPISDVQRRVLAALLPMLCLPYARSALRGPTREWVVTFLLAWGKVAASQLTLPQVPLQAPS